MQLLSPWALYPGSLLQSLCTAVMVPGLDSTLTALSSPHPAPATPVPLLPFQWNSFKAWMLHLCSPFPHQNSVYSPVRYHPPAKRKAKDTFLAWSFLPFSATFSETHWTPEACWSTFPARSLLLLLSLSCPRLASTWQMLVAPKI